MSEKQSRFNRKTVERLADRRPCPTCEHGSILVPNGERMRAYREELKISLNRTAQLMGFSNNHLCNIELGRRPASMAFLEHFVEALNSADLD